MFDYLQKSSDKLNNKKLENFEIFLNLLKEWNNKFNLTSIKEDEEIEIKHFEDCIKGEKFFPLNASVVEIGSGGGFPSIPLMIIREDLKFTLVESVGKKCEFLKYVINKLNLNATVLNKRAEDIAKSDLRESFDVVTARAVARLNTLSEYCLPLIKKEGLFIAYKGSDESEVLEAKKAIEILGGELFKTFKYTLSKDFGERNIFLIKKINKTPIKYPRGNGKERSKPLWKILIYQRLVLLQDIEF